MDSEHAGARPSESVRSELAQLLDADETRMGDVYRLDSEGLSAVEIAQRLDVATAGFVSNYKAAITALLDGAVPVSPTLSGQAASRVRVWLKKSGLSDAARAHLEALQTELQLRSDDEGARTAEESAAQRRTDQVERESIPGIYVYSLPHYLRHPYDPDSGRTLLKVGRSERDAYGRSYSQGRTTALPEDPVLLRVYAVDSGQTAEVERDFHSWLTDADHQRSRNLRGGTEWFLTSTKFLDRVALSRRLPITVVTELEVGET